tara:strand:- start:1515 stop:2033 length:519 start_codon:yes stop_codon:yes gene_type:complete
MVVDIAEQLREILDRDGSVRPDYLAGRGWRSVLSLEPFRPIEADWLAGAVSAGAGCDESPELIVADYETVGKLQTARLKCDRDAIHHHVWDKNVFHTLLVDPEISFLAYFPRHRDHFLLCGDEKFLSQAYPVSASTIRCQYFDSLALLCEREPIIRPSYFEALWTRYTIQGS